MSPIAFNSFRFTDSTLDLNGPLLSFTEQPSDTTVAIGATISLTGYLHYQYHHSVEL